MSKFYKLVGIIKTVLLNRYIQQKIIKNVKFTNLLILITLQNF